MEYLKLISISIISMIASYLGILGPILLVLLLLMILDYITGMWASKYQGILSSKRGANGIIKKFIYVIIIIVGLLLDYVILITTKELGIVLPLRTFFGLLIAIWFVINEMLSILENAIKLESKLPKFLGSFLNKFSEFIEHTGEKEGEQFKQKK